ncbi:MAG: hypothetical protein Q7V57_02305 [Actinomycetota bacterium]|nr:hypothetical protein [Actinomycetota bacterium]
MRRTVLATVVTAWCLLAAACSGSSGSAGDDSADTTAASQASTTMGTLAPDDAVMNEPLFCDPLDERSCLLPWPNNGFTIADPTSPTGRRVMMLPEATPRNAAGTAIDVTDQNRADGFSPMSSILVDVPGLDVGRTGIAPSTDIGASLADNAPLVLLDANTGERVAYWAELDAAAPVGDQVLIVHPASSLAEGHRFVVALRNMFDAQGQAIDRTTAFQAALDGDPEPLDRIPAFELMFADLAAIDISADELYLAWDFTVASAESLSGRLLHIRDDAYLSLGDGAPAFTIASSSDHGPVRTLNGTYEVPNYLSGDGGPGSRFQLGPDGLPVRNATTPSLQVPFTCVVPTDPSAPVPAIVYGHGLMGSQAEVGALSFAAAQGLAAACATDEIGMSAADVPHLAEVLADLSLFPDQADRMQQGLLNQQFLGRLLNAADGFVAAPEFRTADDEPIIAIGDTQFVGNSQGGILGGAASAISTEWSRAVLGVPGIGYSLLLPRSSDWPQFQAAFDSAYTDPAERLVALQLAQMLWDRGENAGYAQHLTTDPYPGIEAKQVLLIEAFGDHQVANVSTEVLARTIDALIDPPGLSAGRSADVEPFWGITPQAADTPAHAVLAVWDYGTPHPPTVNLPPSSPEYGDDPHGAGSLEPRVLQQALVFLLTGQFLDVCEALACTSAVLSG